MRLATCLLVLFSACLMPPQNGAQPGYAGSPASGSPSNEPSPAYASSPTSAAPAATAAPQGPVSVTIRSACSKTVKVFFGDKPKFGSGTYSTIETNSVSSHSFRVGEQLWIVDESENGLGSASVSSSTHQLEVSSSCTAISAT